MKQKKYKFKPIEDSQKEIPAWLTKTVGGQPRVWGQMILNYPIKFVRPSFENKNNPRTYPPRSKIDSLKKRIKRYSLIGNMPVTPLYRDDETGMIVYEVLSGDCRRLSIEELQYETINIEIYEGTEKELSPLRMALNMDSELHPADQAEFIYNVLIKKYGYTHDQISDQCSQNSKSMGRTWVTIMAGIAQNCSKEAMTLWREGKVKQTHVILLSKFFKKEETSFQHKVLKYIMKKKLKGSALKIRLDNAFKKEGIDKATAVKEVIDSTVPTKKPVVIVAPPAEVATTNKPSEEKTDDAKKPKSKKKRVKTRPIYDLISRYKELKTKDDPLSKALVKEYKWILNKRRTLR